MQDNYRNRLNQLITETTNKWFDSLSKEDLLDLIRETESITADFLKTLFRNENVVILGGYTFSTADANTSVTFNGDNNSAGFVMPEENNPPR